MWINEEDKKSYPKFAEFIMAEIPKAMLIPKIWNSFLFYSGLMSEEDFINSEKNGKDSEKKVNKMKDKHAVILAKFCIMSGPPPQIYPDSSIKDKDISGEFNFLRYPNTISINSYWIKKFEMNDNHKKTLPRRYILATVLHEMVHYLDYLHDKKFKDRIKTIDNKIVHHPYDQGHKFETTAFGGIISSEW
jgi:hypothetical protein